MGTRLPICRLSAVGSKPTYPPVISLFNCSSVPGIISCISPRHFNSSIKFFIKNYIVGASKLLYKTPELSPFLAKFVYPKKPDLIVPLAIINCSTYSRHVIIYFTRRWIKNNLIFNHLIMSAGIDAAFYSVMESFKIDFKCNIYVYKPFLFYT